MKSRNKGNVIDVRETLIERSYRDIVTLDVPKGPYVISIVSRKRLTIDVFYRPE